MKFKCRAVKCIGLGKQKAATPPAAAASNAGFKWLPAEPGNNLTVEIIVAVVPRIIARRLRRTLAAL